MRLFKKILSFVGKVIFVFFIMIVMLYLLFVYPTYIGGGYKYIQGRRDDWHIEKNGQVIVEAAVLDLQVKSNFVFGLRLPSEHLECNGGNAYKIRLINEDRYFIFNTDSAEISEFTSRKTFEEKLKSLKLIDDADDIKLDYSMLRYTWDKYSEGYKKTDYSSCVKLSAHDNYSTVENQKPVSNSSSP